MLRRLRTRVTRFDWTPPERRCVHCGRGWLTWRGQRVRHTDCWIAMGFAPILYTEMGERYLRDDPVPPKRKGPAKVGSPGLIASQSTASRVDRSSMREATELGGRWELYRLLPGMPPSNRPPIIGGVRMGVADARYHRRHQSSADPSLDGIGATQRRERDESEQ